jgi:hypothetical protein
MLPANPDVLVSARHQPPSKVLLAFADGRSWTRSFEELELDMTGMKLKTIKASASGDCMEVTSKGNKLVQIDSSALRATVDPVYKDELDRALVALRGPLETLLVTVSGRQQTAKSERR